MKAFNAAFDGAAPTHVSRAPGRVNLIGEHTDYNGLPVFPMALRQEMRVFFRPRTDQRVRFFNADPEFPMREFELSTEIPAGPGGDWGNYLKAPCQALIRRLGPLRGMDALLSSNIPVASGLSSSSALVISVGQALLQANGTEVPTLELADEMAGAERYTGTQGGGMDQAISLGAVSGHASRIEFEPLQMFETAVPKRWRFVVGHTLVRAEKSGAAQAAYNQRRKECGEALTRVSATLPKAGQGLEGTSPSYPELLSQYSPAEILSPAEAHLPPILLRRFRHVVTETARVYEAEEAMRREDLLSFGILMDASHESLRIDYQVSCPELDQMVDLARDGGAAGSRLTGAGFGGCMVALADADHVDGVLASLQSYYGDRGVTAGSLAQFLFVAEPSQGATVGAF